MDTSTIRWNGLQLTLPATWEVIVTGPHHLIIEHNFQPVYELRWQRDVTQAGKNVLLSLEQQVAREIGLSVSNSSIPKELLHRFPENKTRALSWQNKQSPDCLLHICPDCNSVLYCTLFHHEEIVPEDIWVTLSTIHCHSDREDVSTWSIQDFTFSMEPTFQLSDFTFKPGLSRIAFADSATTLQLCRLAPASQRLTNSTLSQLLNSMQGKTAPTELITAEEDELEHQSSPTIFQQLLFRIRKQKPFCWGKIRHDKTNDRLLAMTAQSTTPLDLNSLRTIYTSYEII